MPGTGVDMTPISLCTSCVWMQSCEKMNALQAKMGGTDCALPTSWMRWIKKLDVDVFRLCMLTARRGAGKIHPMQALQKYRRRRAFRKLVVVGMVANRFYYCRPRKMVVLSM